MIIQIDQYKFDGREVESFGVSEGQSVIEIQRIGAKPILQDNGSELWNVDIGIRSTTQIVTDLESKLLSILALKRQGSPVAFIQGSSNWSQAMITNFDMTVEEMDSNGNPLVISARLGLKEYVTK